MKKSILIAFYSRAGNNIVNGRVVNLPVGNTEVVARLIQDRIGGDLFKIDSIFKYSEDYTESTREAMRDLRADLRPELAADLDSIDQYDTVILGYPNWWATMPMPVWTFLGDHDFNGKTILPLCTHEGSGMSSTESDIKKLCPEAIVLKGLPLRGGSVSKAGPEIDSWLRSNGLL